jgi:hypothetical protein
VRWKTIGWPPLGFLAIHRTGQLFKMNEGLEEVLGFRSSALLSFTEMYVMACPSGENANASISWRLSVVETELRF